MDEDELQAMLDAEPTDHATRLVLSGWLLDHSESVPCGWCKSGEVYGMRVCKDGVMRNAYGECPRCKGTEFAWCDKGQRAEGYRVLALLKMHPCHLKPTFNPVHDHWMWQMLKPWPPSSAYTFDPDCPEMHRWFREIEPRLFGAHFSRTRDGQPHGRRAAEDMAAVAFWRLSADDKAAVLARC